MLFVYTDKELKFHPIHAYTDLFSLADIAGHIWKTACGYELESAALIGDKLDFLVARTDYIAPFSKNLLVMYIFCWKNRGHCLICYYFKVIITLVSLDFRGG